MLPILFCLLHTYMVFVTLPFSCYGDVKCPHFTWVCLSSDTNVLLGIGNFCRKLYRNIYKTILKKSQNGKMQIYKCVKWKLEVSHACIIYFFVLVYLQDGWNHQHRNGMYISINLMNCIKNIYLSAEMTMTCLLPIAVFATILFHYNGRHQSFSMMSYMRAT